MSRRKMVSRCFVVLAGAAIVVGICVPAPGITVAPGAGVDAVVYGGVRYRDFGQNNNEWDIGLFDYRSNTTVPQVNKTYYQGKTVDGSTPYGAWLATNSIKFVYEPGKISTDVTSLYQYHLETAFSAPANTINYLQINVRDINVSGQLADTVSFVLTDINGNPLSGTQYTFTADNAYLTWNLTDSSLFANGFILNGSLNLTGSLAPANSEKNELLDIKFGYSAAAAPVPEPLTMVSAFFAIGGLGTYLRKRIRNAVA